MKSILVTGSAGFIGANLVKRLLTEMMEGTIIGLDNLNNYYDVSLKEYRLRKLETLHSQFSTINYQFFKGSIADKDLINKLFTDYQFDIVVNLAAQAGVRYSIENPDAYIESNILGFYNILEACRHSMDDVRWMGTMVFSIWSMPVQVRFMEAIRRCLSALTTVWTTQ